MIEWNTGHKLALVGGVGALGTDVAMNVINLHDKTGTYFDPSIAAAIVAGFVTVIAVGLISQTWRERKVLSCVGVVALLATAMAFSFTMSIDRVTQQHEASLMKRALAEEKRRIDTSIDKVRIEEVRSIIKDENLIAVVQRECVDDIRMPDGSVIQNASYDPTRHRPEMWPRCASAHKRLASLRSEIEQAQAMLAAMTKVELWEVDASAKSLAQALPVSQRHISHFTPWLLPLVLLIGGAVLLHIGASGRNVTFAEKVRRYVDGEVDRTGKRPTIKSVAKAFDISEARAKKYMAA